MLKLSRAVIVEGKYDKIRLENIVDAVIIPTNGFRIFKDEEKRRLIKKIAEKKGIIVLTDSDKAGSVIRSHIKSIASSADIISVYLPQISGKERRKTKPSAEGLVGVEGTPDEIIIKALERFSVSEDRSERIEKIDLYHLGLSGSDGSAEKRKALLTFLDLPPSLTAPALLDALNSLYTKTEFMEVAEKWLQEWEIN